MVQQTKEMSIQNGSQVKHGWKYSQKKLNQKSDLFDRDYKYEKVDLNDKFPEYIINNKKKFNEWII